MSPDKDKKNHFIFKWFIILFLACLIFSVIFVDIADARSSSKKSSTAEKRSELKESTKEQVEKIGSCTSYCEIDHRTPLKCGGSNDASNLQSLPENVHKEKTSREAKLCTENHPELTCGGLKQETIAGFVVYICVNAEPPSQTSYSQSSGTPSYKKTSTPNPDEGSSSRKCWVNGYTTKKGTQVNGYYRRC